MYELIHTHTHHDDCDSTGIIVLQKQMQSVQGKVLLDVLSCHNILL